MRLVIFYLRTRRGWVQHCEQAGGMMQKGPRTERGLLSSPSLHHQAPHSPRSPPTTACAPTQPCARHAAAALPAQRALSRPPAATAEPRRCPWRCGREQVGTGCGWQGVGAGGRLVTAQQLCNSQKQHRASSTPHSCGTGYEAGPSCNLPAYFTSAPFFTSSAAKGLRESAAKCRAVWPCHARASISVAAASARSRFASSSRSSDHSTHTSATRCSAVDPLALAAATCSAAPSSRSSASSRAATTSSAACCSSRFRGGPCTDSTWVLSKGITACTGCQRAGCAVESRCGCRTAHRAARSQHRHVQGGGADAVSMAQKPAQRVAPCCAQGPHGAHVHAFDSAVERVWLAHRGALRGCSSEGASSGLQGLGCTI